MPDVLNPQQRHRCMSHIRSKATKPEILVRKWHIVMRKYRTAIFVNGCFWHGHKGCKQFVLPKTNTEFWQNKIENNRARDQRNYDILLQNGWQVIVLWQCYLTKEKLENTMQSVALALNHNYLKLV